MRDMENGKASRSGEFLYAPRLNTLVVAFMLKSVKTVLLRGRSENSSYTSRLNTPVVAFMSNSVETVL